MEVTNIQTTAGSIASYSQNTSMLSLRSFQRFFTVLGPNSRWMYSPSFLMTLHGCLLATSHLAIQRPLAFPSWTIVCSHTCPIPVNSITNHGIIKTKTLPPLTVPRLSHSYPLSLPPTSSQVLCSASQI